MSLGTCIWGRTLLPLILRASPCHGLSPRIVPSVSSHRCLWIQSSLVHSERSNVAQRHYSQTSVLAVEDISDVVTTRQLTKPEKEQDAVARFENFTDEEKKKLKVLKLEYDVLLYNGSKVPENMSAYYWSQIFDCKTTSARRKLYSYFLNCEKSLNTKTRKKAERMKAEALSIKDAEPFKYNDGIKSTIFMYIRKSTKNTFYLSRLAHAMCYGPSLIFDMDFESMMTQREQKLLLKQLWIAHGENKRQVEPYHFVFCNFSTKGNFLPMMQASCYDMQLSEYLFTLTEKSYLDLYPKERLVYLTPNARDELDTYDPNDVFIIGGYVDKSNPKPVTLAKAKKEKLRMAKLPLDRYLRWLQGTKSLTIDQMTCIMLEWKRTRDWEKALRFVPQRKLYGNNHMREEHGRNSLQYDDFHEH